MKKAMKAYLVEQEANIQTMVESRAMQKLWDRMVEEFEDELREFIAYPDTLRSVSEEDMVMEITDYAFGQFVKQYGADLITMAKATERELKK